MNGNWALLVEDETATGRTLIDLLHVVGYGVQREASGHAALARLHTEPCELLVVDLRLPELDGVQLARAAMAIRPGLHVVLVAAVDPRLGATLAYPDTDHQLAPIAAEQLADRAALVRRQCAAGEDDRAGPFGRAWRIADSPTFYDIPGSTHQPAPDPVLHVGSLMINTQRHLVIVGARSIELTSLQFNLLVYLATNCERVVAQRELACNVLGYDITNREAGELVKVHVHNIRELIENDTAHPRLLLTVRGVGYKLTAGR